MLFEHDNQIQMNLYLVTIRIIKILIQPGMIDDFMLCLVSDDNLYQGKILVNVIRMKSQ